MRVASMLTVVVLHGMMVGASTAPDGTLTMQAALSGSPAFAALSWLFQVMPLFFIAGGFAALRQWRAVQGRGGSWADFIAGRLRSLVLPTLLMIGVCGAVLAIGGAAVRELPGGPAMITEASLRAGQPLWFLAVYLGVMALAPLVARCHERAPGTTFCALAMGTVIVDVLRMQTGDAGPGTVLGYLNLALVWPLMLQLGFLYHDGAAATWSRQRLLGGAGAAFGALLCLVATGAYSADMLVNLNPPTAALGALGIAQFFLLRLLAPLLERLGRNRWILRAVAAGNARTMTVYLWHMPVMLGIVALLHGTGVPMPEVHSPEWWLTRPLWLLAAGLVLVLTVRPLHRLGSAGAGGGTIRRSPMPVLAAVLASIAGVAIVLLLGFDPLIRPVVATMLLVLALLCVRPRGSALARDGHRSRRPRPRHGRPAASLGP